ncbi:MAG: O-antigen ligase family protein [Patescibacteria group bacterium]|nr:O-antigen ligase family protein [Patescibacteria group bacterium]MDD4610961.1 O-antigen ligase family protein [Patescibacteria group bacterium]
MQKTNKNNLILANFFATTRIGVLARLLILTLPFLVLLIWLDIANIYIISAIFVLALVYVFKKHIWLLPIISLPLLAFGQIIYIPITPSWVYEASIAEAAIIFSTLVILIDAFINQKIKDLKFNNLFIGLFIYFVLSVASFTRIIDFRLYVYGIKIVALAMLSYFIALNLFNTRERIRAFFLGLASLILVLSAQIFVKFYALGFSLKFFFFRNDISIAIGPIAIVSAILVLALPLILAASFVSKGRDKLFLSIAFSFGSLAVFLSLGKGAIISLSLGLVYLFVRFKTKRVAFFSAASLFVAASYLFFESFFSGIFFRMSQMFTDVSSKFRVMELEAIAKIISEHFWLGVGSGQQMIYYTRYLFRDYRQLANNFLLQSWMDLGIVGLLAIIVLIIIFVKNTKRVKKELNTRFLVLYYGFVACFLVALFNGLVEVTFFAIPYAIIFWLMAGAFSNLKKYETVNNHN